MPLTEEGRGTGVVVAVDLVNSWDELVSPPELLRSVESLRRLLLWHGFEPAATAVTEADLESARDLRAEVARAFDAADEAEAVGILNRLLAESGVPPQLEEMSGGWRLRCWPDEREGIRFLRALVSFGLLETILEGGFERFGRCDGSPCRCAYIDRSRNRSRRYCCQLCADRVAQAAYRRRQRGRTAEGSM